MGTGESWFGWHMSDGLFCGDGASKELMAERDLSLSNILKYRGLDPVTSELVRLAWERPAWARD